MRLMMSRKISQSARASPGGSTALLRSCTRRSVFENVPSTSAKAAAGRTMSAILAVSVRNMSWTTRNSTRSRAARVLRTLASDTAVFSPMMYTTRTLSSRISSRMVILVLPGLGSMGTPHSRSQASRASRLLMRW